MGWKNNKTHVAKSGVGVQQVQRWRVLPFLGYATCTRETSDPCSRNQTVGEEPFAKHGQHSNTG